MARKDLIALVAVLAGVGALALVSGNPAPAAGGPPAAQVPRATAVELAPPTQPGPDDADPLSHGVPPAPERLANDVRAQAAYDAAAQPGDFVTPPNVSIEH